MYALGESRRKILYFSLSFYVLCIYTMRMWTTVETRRCLYLGQSTFFSLFLVTVVVVVVVTFTFELPKHKNIDEQNPFFPHSIHTFISFRLACILNYLKVKEIKSIHSTEYNWIRNKLNFVEWVSEPYPAIYNSILLTTTTTMSST